MSEDQKYNGWSNYPTWCVNLWFQNEEGLYNLAQEMAEQAFADAEATEYLTREEAASIELADVIKHWVEEQAGAVLPDASMLSDLMQFAIDEADYREIADNWLQEVKAEADNG